MSPPPWVFSLLAALTAGAVTALAEDGLFLSKQLTPKNEYTFQIEGPAVDGAGNLYVGNLATKTEPNVGSVIGRVKAGATKSTPFAKLPVKNGIKSIDKSLSRQNAGQACSTLAEFVKSAQKESGKKLTPAQSAQLIAAALQLEVDRPERVQRRRRMDRHEHLADTRQPDLRNRHGSSRCSAGYLIALRSSGRKRVSMILS